jgi:phosphoglycolate phosphatase-like HAD superfamily hydrolase
MPSGWQKTGTIQKSNVMKIIIQNAPPAAREYFHAKITSAAVSMGIPVSIEFGDNQDAEAQAFHNETLAAQVQELSNALRWTRENESTLAARVKELIGGLLEAERLLALHGPRLDTNPRLAKWKAQLRQVMGRNEPEEPKPCRVHELLAAMANAGAPFTLATGGLSPETLELLLDADLIQPADDGMIVVFSHKLGESFSKDAIDAIKSDNPAKLRAALVKVGLI